jgi:pyrimidine-nucleoside phosphorylase
MNQPLGNAVGNALELIEAIQTLQGGGPEDFREHCLEVASHMLVLGEVASDETQARQMASDALASGSAWSEFRALVAAQGGDVTYVDHPELLPGAAILEMVPAPRDGYLSGIDARMVGETAVLLGAGRAKKGDPIDHAVGIVIHHKVGGFVVTGEPLFTIHANQPERVTQACEVLLGAHTWSDDPVDPLPLFHGVVRWTDAKPEGRQIV